MTCPSASWVEQFVGGRSSKESLPALEQHIEECGECFLRAAAGAEDLPEDRRASLKAQVTASSHLERCLTSVVFTDTVLTELLGPTGPVLPRRRIGPYFVSDILGVGGMSIVYRAKHEKTRREVALKTVKTPLLASCLAMLRREIEFLRTACHPAIVAVLDSDLMADEPWYAMELFDGPRLDEFNRCLWRASPIDKDVQPALLIPRLAAGGRLADALVLFARLCDPLGFIHSAGLVHGDIKPSNVFLRSELEPVLMDFGLVSRAGGTVGRETLDVTGGLRGTLPYIAPEIIRGHIPDARADLYALGCMLYEILVGAPPFVSDSGMKIIDMHLGMAPIPPAQLVSRVPPELDELVVRLLAKNPYERFGHASALGASLASMAEALSPTSRPTRPTLLPSESTTPLFRPPIAGRDLELDRVMACASKARETSSGGVFLVSGESGIGKTFFAAEVAQRALLAGVQVITSECVPLVTNSDVVDAGSTPLQAFRPFFERLRDRCHERGPSEVARLFADRLPLLANHIPTLRGLAPAVGTTEAPPVLPALAARERIVTAVVETIAAYVRRPLLMAIDDLQWADDLSLAVLERFDDELLGRLPLLILGTYRSDEAGEAIHRLAARPWSHSLQLGRLERSHISALVGGMLSMSAPPDVLVDYVDKNAEGIPFFAAEYLRSLMAAGALVYRAGAWGTHAGNFDPFDVAAERHLPRTLQSLIRGRLDRLAPDLVDLLAAGATLGRQFSISLISHMVSRPAADVASLLTAAIATQIINSDGVDSYTFLHDKIRETLYEGLSGARRTQLHFAAAQALERERPVSPDRYGAIGHHFRNGGDPQRALEYLEKAGTHALEMAANADADRFFRDAVTLEATLYPRQPDLRRARWLRQQGDALGGLGRMAESAAALKASAALLGRPFPTSKPAFAVQLAREVVTQVWHRVRPRSIRRPTAEQADINAELVHVFERMHEVSYYLGRDADLVLSTTVSLNSAERAGPTPSLAVAYSNAAMMAGVLPLPKLADRYFRLATAASEAAPDLSAESWLLEMEGHYRGWQGRREQGVTYLERAITLARQGGFFRRADEAECVRIGLDIVAGFHGPALDRAASVESGARKRHDGQVQCWAILQRAEAQLIAGNIEAGLASVTSAEPLLSSLGRPERIWATGLEAYIRYRRQEMDLAGQLVERGSSLALGGPPVHSYCVGACDRLAESAVGMCLDATTKASFRTRAALAERACSILARAKRIFANARPSASLHRGTLDIILRKRGPAAVMTDWRRTAGFARELALPYHELRVLSAIDACGGERRDAQRRDDRSRMRELAAILEIEAPAPLRRAAPSPFSRSRIQIKRKSEQPFA